MSDEKALLREIAILAGGGLCCFKAEGKHAFLRDISKKCALAGFDVIGEPMPPTSVNQEVDDAKDDIR